MPDPDDRAEVHRVIYEELCLGSIKDSSRDRYLDVARRLADSGAQGLVLGCTEIELLLRPGDTTLRQYPDDGHPRRRDPRRSRVGLA